VDAPRELPKVNPDFGGSVDPLFAESDVPKLKSLFFSDPNENAGAVVAVDPLPNLNPVSAGLDSTDPNPVDPAVKDAGAAGGDASTFGCCQDFKNFSLRHH
jgi:hypothetical protein